MKPQAQNTQTERTPPALSPYRLVAAELLRRLADGPALERALIACAPGMADALERTARPEEALDFLLRLAERLGSGEALVRAMADHPRLGEVLIVLSAGSRFLGDILLRDPELLPRLHDVSALAQALTPAMLRQEIDAILEADTGCNVLDALRRFQRWHLLRIGVCDLIGLLDLSTVTGQLSALADSLIQACLELAARGSGHGSDPGDLAVIALGKLGGGELNYSSDIDLVLIAGDGCGPRHERLGAALIDGLSRVTGQGFLYRVDMRLRPWGRVGPLVSTLSGYLAYFQREARLWEKQALLKARPVAGDLALGREALRRVRPLIVALRPEDVRRDVVAMKQRIEREHTGSGGMKEGGVNVKHGVGSIRDVEFVTQYLQLRHGGERNGELLQHNTMRALAALAEHGILPERDYRILAEGYTFLRPLEHYVQIMQNRQTHALPEDPDALDALARRLGFGRGRDVGAGAELLARHRQHSAAIRSVYRRYLEQDGDDMDVQASPLKPSIARHVSRMAPSYAEVFTPEEIRRHAALAESLSDEVLVRVEAANHPPPEGGSYDIESLREVGEGAWRVTIVGWDYVGELSLICGLLFVYGLDIVDGHVFTYEPQAESAEPSPPRPRRRPRHAARLQPRATPETSGARPKIVDVFTVRPTADPVTAETWAAYQQDLEALLRRMEAGDVPGAQGALVRRVAAALGTASVTKALPPIAITLDSETATPYTILDIQARDTPGFLYEFTNALALHGLHISRVEVDSLGDRVYDRFYLTDLGARRQVRERELRATVALVKHFVHLLPLSSNPEAALLHFREFLARLLTRPDWPDELTSLENPQVLEALARLLGVSEFLWDDFLRMQHDNLFPVLREVDAAGGGSGPKGKSRAQLEQELDQALEAAPDLAAKRAALNAFKDRETFRVDMRHILGRLAAFGQFSTELTEVSEVVVAGAYRLCYEHLAAEFGQPRQSDGAPVPLVVCALGKCGGRELGYASDIELLFIYSGAGDDATDGPTPIPSADFYNRLVVCFLDSIQAKREGIFEIDLRLRPYGQAGSLAVPLDAFRRYFRLEGPAWAYERQALVKLRPVAGDEALGQEVEAIRDEIVYHPAALDLAAIKAMRERQLRHLVAGGTLNAKFSPGGLVDVEYLVQGLQMRHGRTFPALRTTNTREAIEALGEAGVLTLQETARLRQAHIFLRQLIDALRMVRGNARDLTVPAHHPENDQEFAFLARRLGYGDNMDKLSADLDRYMGDVRELAGLLQERA